MLKFEIRKIIVDKEIVGEDVLELVNNFGDDTVNMREIETEEKIRLKYVEEKLRLKEIEKEEMQEERRIEEMHMQIKMKELELEQFMLSKKKEESAFGVTFKYKINLMF